MDYAYELKHFIVKFSSQYGKEPLFNQLFEFVKDKCYLNGEQAMKFIVDSVVYAVNKDIDTGD